MKKARFGRRLAAAILVCLTAAGGLTPVQAEVAKPTLALRAANRSIKVLKRKHRPVWLNAGIYVAALGVPFELHVSRLDYRSSVEIAQVFEDDSREPLDETFLNETWLGLKDFLEIKMTKRNGVEFTLDPVSFCPNTYDPQRLSDDGPHEPSYPPYCSANPFTKGVVWGIDQGWAASAFGYNPPFFNGRKGLYTMTVSFAEKYVEAFDIPPAQASTSVKVEIVPRRCRRRCGGGGEPHSRAAASAPNGSLAVPDMPSPPDDLLPDMMSLPAWGISADHRRKTSRDFLSFGATVWVGGGAPLVVEGFRREREDTMDAYQYFYQDGEPVGRTHAGEMAYDTRSGHRHWHFPQFAAYSLLDSTKQSIVTSKKEAFCLAPTDAIDLSLPKAEWNPERTGLRTTCGRRDSLWVRETLPLGWGDTYFQWLPGQSFDITDLPNGTYYIKVEANPAVDAPGGPERQLLEQNTANNARLRKVRLRGRPGHRRVIVPAWRGIDTENWFYF